jgi:secreted trypsin-like serine protease
MALLPTGIFISRVDKLHVHPYYEFTPQADRYDVAVMKLSRPVRYDVHIRPICLPKREMKIPVGSKAMVAGWGATEPDSIRRPKELQAVDVNVVDNSQCENWHASKGINIQIYDDMLCAGYENGGKDACQGDSGGPLMKRMNHTSENNANVVSGKRWTLIGLVSAGYSCAKPGQPGIYHRLTKSADWITYVRLYL